MLWHNNPSPSILMVETAAPTAPAAGEQRLFIDPADHHVKREDASSVIVDLEAIGQMLSADPSSPVNGQFWVIDDGGSPSTVALRFRKGGQTYTLAEVTVVTI